MTTNATSLSLFLETRYSRLSSLAGLVSLSSPLFLVLLSPLPPLGKFLLPQPHCSHHHIRKNSPLKLSVEM